MKNRFYPDWKSFAYKYQGHEQNAFEDLARILLRKELGIKQGLFQRVNHKGNETNVIEKDGKVIGFQAKYFDHGIDADKIIHSMRGAKEVNPNQTHYYIYCNQAFGNPKRRKGQKATDPVPQITVAEEKIQNVARELGFILVWKLNKAILDEVVKEKWIYDVFFDVEGKLESLVKEEKRHTEVAFNSIGYTCSFNDKEIHIKREDVIIEIANQKPSSICVIHGDGGCGKTAVLHEFFDKFGRSVPVCYRKASSLNVKSLAEVFHQGDTYSFSEFKEAYDDCVKKYFIIDSAEHIDEIENGTIVPTLLKELLGNQWCIVFTVRNVFAGDLLNLLSCELGEFVVEKKEIGLLTEKELKTIARLNGIPLPKDQTLVDRIRNLFYLNLYTQYYNEIDLKASDSSFLKLVWEKRIRGKNNRIGFLRENEFEAFIEDKIKSGSFFMNPRNYTSEAFYSLVDDEIIALDSTNGFFVTHDIFEEWGMYRIVDSRWDNADNVSSFLISLGDTRAVRRMFRLWLKDKACDNPDTIQSITQSAFTKEMPGLWKDEVLCALLLSDKPALFFDQYEKQILNNKDGFAEKIIWALRVGCLYVKDVLQYKDYYLPCYAAMGSGWEYIINILYNHQNEIDFALWLPMLLDWTKGCHRGETTRKVGLMTITYYQSKAYERDRFRDDNEKLVHEILNNSVWEVKDELVHLLQRCIENKDISDDLPEFILKENRGAMNIHWAIPQKVIDLCLYYWRKHDEEGDSDDPYNYHFSIDRNGFGLAENGTAFNYFPPGADQTPVTALLMANEKSAVDFIIRLMNESIDSYAQSEYKDTLSKVEITDGKERHNWQWHSWTLWGMYRSLGNPIAPYCLMSVHMALERYLLVLSKERNFTECKGIMQRLLFECHSSSVSAVVGSLVLAYPNEYWQEALILFRVIDFIKVDGQRATDEDRVGSYFGCGAGLNREVEKERIETTKQSFRKKHLENICLDYQYVGSKILNVEENEVLIQQIYGILDEHRGLLDITNGEEGNMLEILLSRMDRRRLTVSGHKNVDGGVMFLLNAELNKEARIMSDEAEVEHREMFKYLGLFNWAYARMRGDTFKNQVYDDKDLERVFGDACALESELVNGRMMLPIDRVTLPWVGACLVKFYRNDLSSEQLKWSKSVIDMTIEGFNGFLDVMDGNMACIQVLPILMDLFPQEKESYSNYLFRYLQVPDYGNLSPCDMVLATIREFELWEKETLLIKSLLAKYVKSFKSKNILPHNLKVIFGLIPDNPDMETAEIAVCYLKQLPELLAKGGIMSQGMFEVLDSLARLFLTTKSKEILKCLPCTQAIVKERYLGHSFLTQLILEEDIYKQPDRFWLIWNSYRSLIPYFVRGWNHEQIRAYTLNTLWKEDVNEWHSLRPQDLDFFMYLAEHSEGNAIVFDGLVKILTTIGTKYKNEGMSWIATAIKQHPVMNLSGTSALFYLELVMTPYIYTKKMMIRKNPNLLAQVRSILNFMVSKSSVTGYMLRDLVN